MRYPGTEYGHEGSRGEPDTETTTGARAHKWIGQATTVAGAGRAAARRNPK
jgi:hypothetical protein